MKKFYVTTAIPYVNASPHIGFALEVIQTDVLARYHRDILGEDTWFLTGTDDNSLKNVQAAEKEGIPVKEFVDRNSKAFANLKKSLNLSNDDFIRTTSKKHYEGAQKLWKACEKDIYKKKYKGLYCVGCEEFKRVEDLMLGEKKEGEKIGYGCCPEHPNDKIEVIEEENYFFTLSKYQKQLEKIVESDEYMVIPETRKNEALSFIKQGLEDFSISRSRERAYGWGIPVPGDESQVIYVWFDALINYITGIGFVDDEKKFEKYWPADVHVIGKGILKFHAIYWPAMLLSAGVSLPRKLFVHGYVTTGGEKISKSLGNSIDPAEIAEKYGTDALRYYLLRYIPSYKDGDFSLELFEKRYETDLANDLGNLLQRVLVMIDKYKIKIVKVDGLIADQKIEGQENVKERVCRKIDSYNFSEALNDIWALAINAMNISIEKEKPWELAENDQEALQYFLSSCHGSLLQIAELIYPFMPEASQKIKKQLGSLKPEPLFPRLESK